VLKAVHIWLKAVCVFVPPCPAAHLWSSIFNMAFDLGLVEDAYTAALSNPQHDLAEDKIRRLVLNLVEQGQEKSTSFVFKTPVVHSCNSCLAACLYV
jgi:hypothetical protein